MNLLQNLGASAGSRGDPARESRLEVLEQEILNTPREQLPDVIAKAMNDFYANKWSIVDFVHHLLWHAEVDVHLALLAFSESVITEGAYGSAFAEEFRQFLADAVTRFVFRTTNEIIHAGLFKVCGLRAPFYRAEPAMMSQGQSMAQAGSLPRPGFNAPVQSNMTQGQAMTQAARLARAGLNAPVKPFMRQGQSTGQVGQLSNPGSRAPVTSRMQLSLENASGTALEVRGGGGGQMVRHEAQVDVGALEKRLFDKLLNQMTPQLAKIGTVVNGVVSRVGHLEEGHAMNSSRVDQLEHGQAVFRAENKANHEELKQLILGNRGPAAPVSSYPPPQGLSAFVRETAAREPGYAGFMGMDQPASLQGAASSAGGFMSQNKSAASLAGGFMSQKKSAASSAGLGGHGSAPGGSGRGGFMGKVPLLVEDFPALVGTTAGFLSENKLKLVQQTIEQGNFPVNGPEYASVVALGVKYSKNAGSQVASEKLTAAIRVWFPDFSAEWLPENFARFSSTLGTAPDVGVKRPFSEISSPNAEVEHSRIVKIPHNAFLGTSTDAPVDGAGGGTGGLGASPQAEEQGVGDGGAPDGAAALLAQKLAEAEAAAEENFDPST